MALSSLLPGVLWTFFGLSIAAECILAYGAYTLIDDGDTNWQSTTFMTIADLGSMGLMVSTLLLLGHSIAALEVWRILSVFTLGLSLYFAFSTIRNPTRRTSGPLKSESLQVAAIFVVAALALFFAVASFLVTALPYFGAAATSSPVAATPNPSPVLAGLSQLDSWHTALYVILTVASVLFGLLFVSATAREGPPSFEKNWGGLGGNTGGWEISSSLTYLVAMMVAGVLLLSLIFHSDTLQQQTQKQKADERTVPAASQPAAAMTGAPSEKAAAAPLEATQAPEGNKASGPTAPATAPNKAVVHPGERPDAH